MSTANEGRSRPEEEEISAYMRKERERRILEVSEFQKEEMRTQ